MRGPYIIGIDLGTTHCVLAYTKTQPGKEDSPPIEIFRVPQLVGPGEVGELPLLPSFLLLPQPHEAPPESLALPWESGGEFAVGEFARRRGAELPNRLVLSAKSWLSYSGVDRTRPVLPWDAPSEGRKVSPVEASTLFLAHLRDAWNHTMAAGDPEARIENQELFLTVPASFDAVARELTVKAAVAAGLGNLTLLEEPLAAFYSWLEAHKDDWRKEVRVGDSILICDVGGGTTDLSLIEATEENGDLVLGRAAVGDHILLGGDNMDLTLAYTVQAKLAGKGVRLDPWQFRSLSHSCRIAKERLLANPDLENEPVVILGRGSSLIGGTIRTELTRSEAREILLDGFFPESGSGEYPESKRRVGMREMGLPYEADPAVSRHLARFLGRQTESGGPGVKRPTAVLFNGGVFKPSSIRDRVLSIFQRWYGGEPLRELSAVDLDLAVARGAAYYGLARRGRGIRIRSGTARTYYIGVESAMPAVPGVPTPMKALCVAPFGMEEGSGTEIRRREFGLIVGEPAVFHLMASTVRKKDQTGEIVEDWSAEIEEVNIMETELEGAEAQEGVNPPVPIWLESKITEVGTMELWCVERDGDRRWKLEFNLREREEQR